MLALYKRLADIAETDFPAIIAEAAFIGGTSASPNKLRLILVEGSFVDVWVSSDGDYAFHWERRRQTGQMFRWDNAPHHPQIGTFPAHFHDGEEAVVEASFLSENPYAALREVLEFVTQTAG